MGREQAPYYIADGVGTSGTSVLDSDPREPLPVVLRTDGLTAWYGNPATPVIRNVNLDIVGNKVTALIGPSGCGKSTVLRTMNRMHEATPGKPGVSGSVFVDGRNIYDKAIDPVAVRRFIGMVFQKPVPFPSMSIYENVVSGLTLGGVKKSKAEFDKIVEESLTAANLWNETKDKLNKSGANLSGGQQQRLCIARALVVKPRILLMDEPCSALDPTSTYKIEELIRELAKQHTVVLVTHNMQQAARVANYTGFMLANWPAGSGEPGKLIEYGRTEDMFQQPKNELTEQYITGRFG